MIDYNKVKYVSYKSLYNISEINLYLYYGRDLLEISLSLMESNSYRDKSLNLAVSPTPYIDGGG